MSVECKVTLAEVGNRVGGLFLAGSTHWGIWVQNFHFLQLWTSQGQVAANNLVNGMYLKLEKQGNAVSAFYRTQAQGHWLYAASATLTGTAQTIGLGHFWPLGSYYVVDAYYSELKVRPFVPIGVWNSDPTDLGFTPSTPGTISWKQDLPAGTRIEIQTSTSLDGKAWSPWSAPYADDRGSRITSPPGRYFRVAATLHADPTRMHTPVLDEVRIQYPDAAPLGPLITPLSHPAGGWASAGVLGLRWTMPPGNPAPEAFYDYLLTHASGLSVAAGAAVPGPPGSAHALGVSLPAEGLYTLQLQVTGDAASGGLTAAAQAYSFGYDASPPSAVQVSSPTHPQLLFTNNRNPVFHLSALDSVSGVSGYAAVLDKAPYGDPGTQINAGPELRYGPVDNGTWYLHVRAVDLAGNAGPVTHYGIRVDHNGALLSPDYVKALPNPVRTDQALLEYELAAPATEVRLEFLNSQGEQLLAVDGTRQVGKNRYRWDVGGLANGVYLFRVKARSAEDGRWTSVVRKVAVLR